MIQTMKLILPHIFQTAKPFLLPPFIASDSKSQDIVLKFVHFLRRKSCKTCPKETKDALVAEILLCHIQKTSYVFHERIQQNIALMVHEYRNVIQIEGSFQIIPVGFHAAYDYTDFPKTKSLLPNQTTNGSGGSQRFLPGGSCGMNTDGVLLLAKYPCPVTEQIPFQKFHGFIPPKTVYGSFVSVNRVFHLNPALFGKTHKRTHHMLAKSKQLIRMAIHKGVLPLIHGHRHSHLTAMAHKLQKQPILYRRKAGKPVQHDDAVLKRL